MKHILYMLLVLTISTLTGCGGGSDTIARDTTTTDTTTTDTGTGTGTGDTSSGTTGSTGSGSVSTSTVASIVISAPRSNAIEDNEDGTYRKKFSVSIADHDGTPLPDGTQITLRVVDTVLVQGEITDLNVDAATDTALTLPSAEQADGTPVADLTTTFVTRPGVIGGSIRQILADDLVIMTGPLENVLMFSGLETGQVDSRDVIRTVANTPVAANELTVTTAYNSDYPLVFDATQYGTNYYVAASMLSTSVAGEDADGNATASSASPVGGEGVATVWVTYPADNQHIISGCTPDELDDRVSPAGSSQPYLVATAGGISTAYRFCFSSIAGYSLTPRPDGLVLASGATGNVTVCVADGGDGVSVPFTAVSASQTNGTASVGVTFVAGTPGLPVGTPTSFYTNRGGCFTLELTPTGASGDSGTVTAYAGDGSVDINVSIP